MENMGASNLTGKQSRKDHFDILATNLSKFNVLVKES